MIRDRIMYIEQKTGGSQAFIGRVTFSNSGKTIYYRDMAFLSVGDGNEGNYFGYDKEAYIANQNASPPEYLPYQVYWISGPRKDGRDRLYERPVVHIDEDVREEYWTKIRGLPEFVKKKSI